MKLDWNTDTLSPAQYKIADYIQKNLHTVLFSTEQEIGDALGLSIASVSRFWRSVGFKNIKDFKAHVREQLEVTPVTPAGKMKSIMDKGDADALPGQLLDVSIRNLEETVQHYSPEAIETSVSALLSANTVYLYGPGPSAGLVELMHYRLRRFGLSIRRLDRGGSELFEDLLHIYKGDLVVIFGFVRLLPEAKVIVQHAKEQGYRTLLITDRLISDFSDQTDTTLFASRGETWEFHSMIAPTFLIENLIIAVGKRNQEVHLHKLDELNKLRKKYGSELPR
ncbi:DNA-binding MurR/RpiR family transcriptional regulator [Fontibacillus solani]|uniref:DNA-binding MurR/RpiR family transcriptional regulator n=1 Tax=Fontibacillus solani TaxID=1572857 RepID=A0A7W3SUR5_9BACL|nr:MurR/RpiR family transcriptional regulator [Fontibacillus solani]MBA9086557.1 DNA-binding MurR/RpiR family transcriptional regulator [Fontibacillus solani]